MLKEKYIQRFKLSCGCINLIKRHDDKSRPSIVFVKECKFHYDKRIKSEMNKTS